jgi:PTH1 family peptidyl-tRNA hydrolase
MSVFSNSRDDNRILVVGLGNPGPTYHYTRHNIGFRVADRLAETIGAAWSQSPFTALWAQGVVGGRSVILAKPMAFMNLSGAPVRAIASHFAILTGEMLVIHDDIDLGFGTLKIKEKGGHGGHNGLRSIVDAFGGGAFGRLRIGIGRPEPGTGVTDHVLGPFSDAEARHLETLMVRAKDAAITVICQGTMAGMNRYNRKAI